MTIDEAKTDWTLLGINEHNLSPDKNSSTPRHNGKVERQHGLDEKRFYSKMKMYNPADGRKQLERYNKKSNNIPKVCLNFRTPNEVLNNYLAVM